MLIHSIIIHKNKVYIVVMKVKYIIYVILTIGLKAHWSVCCANSKLFICVLLIEYFLDEYLRRLKQEQPEREKDLHVFDMGCGKGKTIAWFLA